MPKGYPAVQRTQRMPADLWMTISRLAERDGQKLSQTVNELLREAVEARLQLNLDFTCGQDLRGNTGHSLPT